jgi:hypothetical protein
MNNEHLLKPVVPILAVQRVVAVAAVQLVTARITPNRIVAVISVDNLIEVSDQTRMDLNVVVASRADALWADFVTNEGAGDMIEDAYIVLATSSAACSATSRWRRDPP